MRKLIFVFLVLALAGCGQKAADYPYTGVSFENVRFEDGLLGKYVRTVLDTTIPFAFEKCEQTGRIANFAKAGGLMEGDFIGLRYDDSDVFKVMEAASYALSARYDAALDHYMDSLIVLVGAAQEPDGYLYTIRTAPGEKKDRGMGEERWSKISSSHELYNVGHMYEAAVAHFNATGKRTFLDIAIKNADMLYDTFYATGRKIASGHEEIELALVKLYRATGDARYLDLSRFFLDCRGESGDEYRQDHLPVTEQFEAVGHSVRAVYLYMAMSDIAAITSDAAYRRAVDSLWKDVTYRKLYLTGGIGSERRGERFSEAYFLPNAEAYCETCAGIANCMWNYRMFCLYGDSKYFDVFERSLYNNVLDGISEDGMHFFYANPQERNPENLDGTGPNTNSLYKARRQEWYRTSCCPTNLARFITSLPGYVYAVKDKSIYVNLFERSEATVALRGSTVSISQKTDYPSDGHVRITLDKAPSSRAELRVRIPLWSRGAPVPGDLYSYEDAGNQSFSLSVNGKTTSWHMDKGYAVISRKWKDGDVVELTLPMAFRTVRAREDVEADRGMVAYERGPLVYCLEIPDAPGVDIRTVTAPVDTAALIPFYQHAEGPISQMSVFIRE